jgi:Tfp pilus assembly protein PilO
MKRLNLYVAKLALLLGAPGIVGIGLLVFLAAFYFSALRPEQARLGELRQELAQAQQRKTQTVARPQSSTEKLASFYAAFPGNEELPDLLGKIFASAKRQGLRLEQGEYRVVGGAGSALAQFQITLPVRGTYPQIRKFVDGALEDVPTLSLDSIHFERQKVADTTVEAKVRLAVYLGRRS